MKNKWMYLGYWRILPRFGRKYYQAVVGNYKHRHYCRRLHLSAEAAKFYGRRLARRVNTIDAIYQLAKQNGVPKEHRCSPDLDNA